MTLSGVLLMSQVLIVSPVADVPGFNSGTPVPGSPATHFDKVDEYPIADDGATCLLHDVSTLPGQEYFEIAPDALDHIPGGWSIVSVEAVLRTWTAVAETDIWSTGAILNLDGSPVGQSEAQFIPVGWHTLIADIPKGNGTPWTKADIAGHRIAYVVAGGSMNLTVSQFYVRVNIAKPHGADPSSTAPSGAPSASASAGAPTSSAPSSSPSSTAQAGAPTSTAAGAGAMSQAQAAAPTSTSPAGRASPIDDCTAAPLPAAPGAAPSSPSPSGMPSDRAPEGDAS